MADTTKSQANKLVTAGMIGMAAGAAGILLSDKKNRKKVAAKLDEVKEWSDKTVSQWKQKAEDVSDQGQEMAASAEKKITEKVDSLTKEADETSSELKSLRRAD